jgi:cyanophycinase-like exopeptidase
MLRKLIFLLLPLVAQAQGYTSFFTGNTANIATVPTFGVCLMGGATENDEAMKWLLQRASGGDVVVIRSTGGNGYNNYFYSGLGITVNSVETLVITSAAGAVHPYVLDKVANAELIWFAGGDQSNYVNYFKNNALEDALNYHVNVKNAPIGGTSAGMAILGSHYYSAMFSSVTSSQALSNPYNTNVTLGSNDFLNIPFLQNVITDTHYDNPDRRGRHTAFLARIAKDENIRSFGIASNEYVSVCIAADGKAYVYGEFPQYQEFAYFLQANCATPFVPETCISGSPLTWNNNGQAVKVYKVPGTMTGTNYLDLSDWTTGVGGSWENWSVVNGTINFATGTPNTCILSLDDLPIENVQIYPVPFKDSLIIRGLQNSMLTLFDFQGRQVLKQKVAANEIINTSNLQAGMYAAKIEVDDRVIFKKILKN